MTKDEIDIVPETDFDSQQQEAIKSISGRKIILPIIIGIAVVAVMLLVNFDKESVKSIVWNAHTLGWLILAVILLIARHVINAYRLYMLASDTLSFWKCMQLFVIWEFSSNVSPTALGGSAVSVFVLSQEKLGASRTLAAIIYTVILDTLFFVVHVPLLLLIFGANIINPNYFVWADMDKVAYSLGLFYFIIVLYGGFFTYGLFKNPIQFKKILTFFTRLPILKRWKKTAEELGDEMLVSSKEIASKDWKFHSRAWFMTFLAWAFRFLLVNCLIIALIDNISLNWLDQLKIYGRIVVMFVFMMFSPTPGAAGFAEVFFGGFLSDFIPKGAALIIALIWRFLTYYSYLFAGAIIIPAWLHSIILRKRKEKALKQSASQ